MIRMNGRSILEFAPDKDESLHVACRHIRTMREMGYNLPKIVEEARSALAAAGHEAGRPELMTGDSVTYWLAGLWKDYVRVVDKP